MVSLLEKMAREQLIDAWSSREMISILTKQTHNGLIPAPLPPGTEIAHKTGSLHDTLNDVGIVYEDQEPYVIAVMTTHWPSLDRGRAFIHRVSKLTYRTLADFARWRELDGIPRLQALGMEPFDTLAPPAAGRAPSEHDPAAAACRRRRARHAARTRRKLYGWLDAAAAVGRRQPARIRRIAAVDRGAS